MTGQLIESNTSNPIPFSSIRIQTANPVKLISGAIANEKGEFKPQFDPRSLGNDPKTGFEIMVKIGPYGPYLELIGSEIEIPENATQESEI